MSRFETVMISRARTEKISTLEQEFEAELKQLGKENAKCGKSLIQHISKAQGSTHRLVQDFVVSVPVFDFFLGFGPVRSRVSTYSQSRIGNPSFLLMLDADAYVKR